MLLSWSVRFTARERAPHPRYRVTNALVACSEIEQMQAKIDQLTADAARYQALCEQADRRAEEWKAMVGHLMPLPSNRRD